MSVTSVNNSFDNFTLPTEGEEDTSQLYDATKISWYQKSFVVKTTNVLARLILCFGAMYVTAVIPSDADAAIILKGLAVVVEGVVGIYLIYAYLRDFKGYQDPASRQAYRNELEEGKVSLIGFLNKHSWKDLQVWGFHIHPSKEPLITKKDLAERFLVELGKHFSWYLASIRLNSKKIYTTEHYGRVQITYTHSYKEYDGYIEYLFSAMDYNIFDKEQKQAVQKLFDQNITNMKAETLLNNWAQIKKVGLNCNPDHKRMYQWLENNYVKYEMIWAIYKNQKIDPSQKELEQKMHTDLKACISKVSFSYDFRRPYWVRRIDEKNYWYQVKMQDFDFNLRLNR